MKADAKFVAKVTLGVILAGVVLATARQLPGIRTAALGFDGRTA